MEADMRVVRTNIAPFKPVKHACRDRQGNRVVAMGASSTLCRKCNTQIVYVWDNNKPKKNRSGNR